MQDAPQTAAGVREGDLLAGKYRIDKVLGVGGMGVVVAAHHIHLDEKVAIKFLLPEAMRNPEAVERFAREARAAVKIKSEHVARVSDVGTLETGAPYMVMEYLEGWDLSALVDRIGRLPIEQAVDFVLQTCEAMADAHALGIVHRDLKPANLFCIRQSDGMLSIKVLDFGISKATASSTGSGLGMTKTTAVMGSPLYMSPEQMQSARSVDARTDIWAIGVILYELVTDKVPFNGESLPELCVNIMSNQPAPVATHRPDAPPGLDAVISRCLEKNREKRYANVAELAVALADFAPKRSHVSVTKITRVLRNAGLSTTGPSLFPSTPPSGPPKATIAAATAASWGRTGPSAGGTPSKAWLIAAGAVVFAGLGAGAAFLALRRPEPAPTAAIGLVGTVAPPPATAPATAAPTPVPAAAADAGTTVAEAPSAPPPAATAVAALKPVAAKAAPTKTPKAETNAAAKPAPAAPAAKPDSLGGRL